MNSGTYHYSAELYKAMTDEQKLKLKEDRKKEKEEKKRKNWSRKVSDVSSRPSGHSVTPSSTLTSTIAPTENITPRSFPSTVTVQFSDMSKPPPVPPAVALSAVPPMITVPEDPCNVSLRETVNTGDPVINHAIMEKAHKNYSYAYAVWQGDVEQYNRLLLIRGSRSSGAPIPPTLRTLHLSPPTLNTLRLRTTTHQNSHQPTQPTPLSIAMILTSNINQVHKVPISKSLVQNLSTNPTPMMKTTAS
jgi:hypothetical protein